MIADSPSSMSGTARSDVARIPGHPRRFVLFSEVSVSEAELPVPDGDVVHKLAALWKRIPSGYASETISAAMQEIDALRAAEK